MAQDLEDILRAAMQLPVDARAALASELWSSVEQEGVEVDEETERALLQRLASARAGHVVAASVNWTGLAAYLGCAVEDVRALELHPAATPTPREASLETDERPSEPDGKKNGE